MTEMISKKPGPGRRVWPWHTLAGVVLVIAGLALGVDSFGQRDFARPVDVIVVLGARVDQGGAPGDSLRHRTLRAVQFFREGMAPAILFTGGVGEHSPAEARAARNLARSLGVPEQVCVLEERSTSTWENAVYAAVICRERGWRRVLVVSDPYHLFRASRNFRKVGLEVYTSPARECARNRRFASRVEWALRDGLLVLRDVLIGRA